MPSLTNQQFKATTADVSVALAAGAGCGKTFVLTERFLACLDPERPGGPLRLDQLTAITFTERAAREMRQRIRKTCLERLKAAPEKHVNYWLRTLRDLDAARISTIHSFCGALLRAHAVEARLDPHFQVLDATAAQTLLFELIDEHLRERLVQRDEAVIDLVVTFALDGVRDMAGHLLNQRQAIDWDCWQGTSPGELVARWEKFWRSDTLPRVLAKVGQSPAAATIFRALDGELPSHAVMRARCELLRDRLPRLAEAADPSAALEEIRAAARVQGGGTKKNWPSEDAYHAFRAAAEELRKSIEKVREQAAFDAAKALPAAEASLALLEVARGLATAYEQRKEELAALDFDDLLLRARELLVGPAREDLRRQLAAQTRLLLVDEFQDTDPLQVELVRALCDGQVGDGRLFFVGDYKQSIYRFRGADPHVFRLLREEIPVAGQLPLTRNFRSQPSVLEFVNCLFAGEMGPQYEPLEAHRRQCGPVPAVEFLWAMGEELPTAGSSQNVKDQPPEGATAGADEGPRSERARRREAQWIARRLRAMLDNEEKLVLDTEASGEPVLRAVRPGDITLLFRALTNVEYYEEALRRHNIEYYLVGGHAFYAQQEIFDIVNLLRAVASPCDEVSLVGVLRSPMFGILDETLYHLARHERGFSGGFWSVLDSLDRSNSLPLSFREKRSAGPEHFPWKGGDESNVKSGDSHASVAPAPHCNDDELARLRFAAETLAELRAEKDRMPIARLIHRALERTGYDAMLLGEFLGERKLANLHKLIEQARKFDAAGIFTLSDFIVQLAQFVARQPDEPLAATQPESINAVRLMSIHQSKGLEFPVVVVVDVDRPRRAAGEGVAFTPELGPMVRLPDCTSGYDLFLKAEQDEDLAELTRLLYVATTRAGDYLMLSSGMDDLERSRGPWMELLRRRFDLRTGVPLPPFAPNGAKRALANVILEEPVLPQRSSPAAKRHDLRKTIAEARKLATARRGGAPEYIRPIAADSRARRHYSFSRLHGTIRPHAAAFADSENEEPRTPPGVLDPLGLGTLVHAVLAELVTAADDSPTAIESLVRKHSGIHLPDAGGLIDEPMQLIAGLTATPRWAELRRANCVHAELEFLLAWPPHVKQLANLPRKQQIGRPAEGPYIQGFIDCLYRGSGGDWRVLDYKTNRVSPDTLAAAVEDYEMQMLVYALAAEHVLGRPPVEVVLHFLRGNLEHQFVWTDAARRHVVKLVDAAMDRMRASA